MEVAVAEHHFVEVQRMVAKGEVVEAASHAVHVGHGVVGGVDEERIMDHHLSEQIGTDAAYFHCAVGLLAEVAAGSRTQQGLHHAVVEQGYNNIYQQHDAGDDGSYYVRKLLDVVRFML